jgi:hypothetical protein
MKKKNPQNTTFRSFNQNQARGDNIATYIKLEPSVAEGWV